MKTERYIRALDSSIHFDFADGTHRSRSALITAGPTPMYVDCILTFEEGPQHRVVLTADECCSSDQAEHELLAKILEMLGSAAWVQPERGHHSQPLAGLRKLSVCLVNFSDDICESWPALRALNNRNGKYYFDPPLQ